MKPSEIRDELIAQHGGLRSRIEAARQAVDRWTRGDALQSHVRDLLAELADALRAHNLQEERALRDLVRSVDAWGQARVQIMDEHHVAEHRELFDTLIRVSRALDPWEGRRELESFCRRMLTHMAREEEAFLNPAVLRDDDLSIDAEVG
jgi:hypothetical protein